jgi:hypothetical protein
MIGKTGSVCKILESLAKSSLEVVYEAAFYTAGRDSVNHDTQKDQCSGGKTVEINQ